jgi:outer membrane receptor for ferrienterochelin and colicins
MWTWVVIAIVVGSNAIAQGAQLVRRTLHVAVRAGDAPLPGAEVLAAGTTFRTNSSGTAEVPVSAASIEITVVMRGFLPFTTTVDLPEGGDRSITVELQPLPTIEEEMTVIGATRTDKRLEDQAMRVEVLAREEIEEKMMMTPGDISMMLNEMGGMRVQATSPSLGAASVRVQGMRGRYTRVLSDGLPLFGEVGGLGLLQIPPMDLGQVEVIKGVASALYGAGAMGGVVNLSSRRPAQAAQQDYLFNRSTRGATDGVVFVAGPLTPRWGASLLVGGHWQDKNDVDDDGWADLAGYSRGVVRPRVFWDGGSGRTVFATAGATYEDRQGGTIDGRTLPATGLPYVEALNTTRYDAGAVVQVVAAGRYVVSARIAGVQQRHDHRFGDVLERDKHVTAFGEVALRSRVGRHNWVAGAAIEHDAYTPYDLRQFAYAFTVPGAFGQYELDVTRRFSLSASGRIDAHSEYGTFVSPRVSALVRSGRWNSRLSLGTGFFGPTPLTEETEAAGLTRLTIAGPLKAERGRSASFDVSRSDGPLSYTVTLFSSRIRDPIHVERDPDYVLANLPDAATNAGVELLGTVRRSPVSVTATYTYVRSRERVNGLDEDVPLTPRHSGGVVGMWEREGVGRFGVECYYTGRQRLEENPFREVSAAYAVVGLLAERQFHHLRLFVNGENLTGVRQTRFDPLLRPMRGADGRWTVDAWAPLDGTNINAGLRVRF